MHTEEKWRGFFAALLYGLIYARDLESFFPRTLAMVKTGAGTGLTPEQMKRAIELALSSTDNLAELGDVTHSDEEIRQFFAKILQHLPD